MSNRPCFRFKNTLSDLDDCLEHLNDQDLSLWEERSRIDLIELCKSIIYKVEKKDNKEKVWFEFHTLPKYANNFTHVKLRKKVYTYPNRDGNEFENELGIEFESELNFTNEFKMNFISINIEIRKEKT